MGERDDLEYKMYDYDEVITDTPKATLFATPKGQCWVPNSVIGEVDDEIFTVIETFTVKFE